MIYISEGFFCNFLFVLLQDEEDVRTCLLHFIVAFLLVGDNELIRRLADTKGEPFLVHVIVATKLLNVI